MAQAKISLKDLFEANMHFGHMVRFRNPKMDKFIFGKYNGINIINLEYSLPMLKEAIAVIERIVSNGGKVLFIGTKFNARNIIEEEAKRCDMPYVNYRWLGGMLTNYKTIKQSIRRLETVEKMYKDGTVEHLTKKEALTLQRELTKLHENLNGIKNMAGLPDALFVVDANYEKIAIKEANRLGISVIAIVDTNASPKGVDYVIPGNDDAMRSIRFLVKQIADAVLRGQEIRLSSNRVTEAEKYFEVSEDEQSKNKDAVKF